MLLLLVAGVAGAEPRIDQQIEEARREVAKNRAALDDDLALLGEAQGRQGPQRAQLVALAERTVAEQRQALAQSQQRLDLLVRCRDVSLQLERDQEAMAREQRDIQAGLRELDDWTHQLQQAEKDAVERAAALLADGIIGEFIARMEGGVDEAERELRALPADRFDPVFFDRLRSLRVKVDVMKAARDGALTAHVGWDAVELWNHLHEWHEQARHTAAEVSGLVLALAGNAALWKVVERTAVRAAASTFEKRLMERGFPWVADAMKLGEFTVEYGLDWTHWTLARRQILDRHHMTEAQLHAVAALSCQIERTVARLHQCRGTPPPPQSARCRAP